ncbi:importin alpha re-exporter [Coprinopsis sp. MPI-PUGE-AT-0042]|nr:importin alpha re-exporter [Coprinopsis sp. MPI-PUGE-AT-0042]
MADLPTLLRASLEPQNRKQAEQSLNSLSIQPGFLTHLLGLVLETGQDRAVRLAGSVYLKNIAKLRWEEEEQPIAENDKAGLRSRLVPAMLALSNPSDKAIRAQIAESVALIAQLDFPERWTDLIDQLVSSLSLTDFNTNVGVLETAHSIFRVWRAQVRSDKLFTEINIVLSRFVDPFLQLFKKTGEILTNPTANSALTTPVSNYALVAQTMVLLIDIFYDLTCQDLPPAIEDTYDDFFDPSRGWFHILLTWSPNELKGDADDTNPSLPSQIKAGILEIAEMFIKLYADQLQRSQAVPQFVQNVWQLIGSNKLPAIADDGVVSQSLRFISTAIRSGFYKDLFGSRETISSLIEGVVIPNISLREHDEEQFEDDPLEFIRLDLALSSTGTDLGTRRHAAADVLQALVGGGYETETTELVGNWINTGLNQYQTDKGQNWKSKDSAIFLLTAIATRGSTTQQGVTSTNALVDVVRFFSDHVYQDLQAESGSVHPILQVDAIRFLYTFRNQLTKPQLLSVLPLLARHLASENYVTYTYAAITIDRILFIKQNGNLLFSQADIQDSALPIIDALLSKIEAGGSPAKIAENDHLMKCVMRVILTARQSLTPGYERLLGRLVSILGVISANPSNPRFDQYIFESISALMRFVVEGNPSSRSTFEEALFGPFTVILQQDIEQYIPYVFQVLAQMLELHESGQAPASYMGLLPVLLTPTAWQQKGSIPGLVRLLRAFLSRTSDTMVAGGQIANVLAVVQQRLIPSKMNDSWGFELLQAVFLYVKPAALQQYLKPIIITLLTRMQTSKTDKYVYLFSKFLLYTMAINVDGLGPDTIIAAVESIQPGLWPQVLTNFIIPQAPKVPHKDRKLVVVGMIRLLCQSKSMMQEPMVQSWPAGYSALGKLFSEPQYFKTSDENATAGLTEIDFEEQTAGYQAAYSRLAASESKEVDPVAHVQNPQGYLQEQLGALQSAYPQVNQLIGAAEGGRFNV